MEWRTEISVDGVSSRFTFTHRRRPTREDVFALVRDLARYFGTGVEVSLIGQENALVIRIRDRGPLS